MVFSSLIFLFRYLPIVIILYYISPAKLRNAVLFFASLLFYAWGEPVYIVIMLFSTLVDYTHGILVDLFKEKGEMAKAKLTVASSMIVNLLLLGYFKYSDFLISNINGIFNLNIPLLKLALPIGISFYTFQTMSYTLDIYRGQAKVQRNIISFGAYVALFPQLIAGPIVQFKTVAKQLEERKENKDLFAYGIIRFTIGLGKKVLLANNIGLLWKQINLMQVNNLPVLTAWIGILAFAFQIYFDFSGYSDMAIGLGSLFGFTFLENFNYPYQSKSITEFWRRWHISLGSWFRDYVYIPLGGNRKGIISQIRNISIVWLLTGFWHGASWNFILWGAYFGIILVVEKFYLARVLNKLPDWISRFYTLFIVLMSWVIFAFDDFQEGIYYLKVMFGGMNSPIYDTETLYILYNYAVLLLIAIFASTELPKNIVQRVAGYFINSSKRLDRLFYYMIENTFIIVLFILSIAYLVDASYNPFLYFRF